jgi:glutaminyl-peptide cyclotransferase
MKRYNWIIVLAGLATMMIGAVAAQDNVDDILAEPRPFQQFTVEVINTYPHATDSYTQGLLLHDGFLYESGGQRGISTLRRVELETGEALDRIPLNRPEEELTGDNPLPDYFAEGLALVDDRLIQLTWTAGEAFVYDLETLERVDQYVYRGEGWGLCYDGRYLYHTDGSEFITVRQPDTFEPIVRAAVTFQDRAINTYALEDGQRLGRLNELECVEDSIYANSFMTDFILRIDKGTGVVTGLIDASGLLTDDERAELESGEVLNGIAYNPESDTFYITGKNWPTLFEVRFVPADPANPTGGN